MVGWQRDKLKVALETRQFKEACESVGLRGKTVAMFVQLGREFLRQQFKEQVGIDVDFFVKKFKRKNEDDENDVVQSESSKKAKVTPKELVSAGTNRGRGERIYP
eukprot:7490939-Pyramimonas_sp.AAC.1